MTIRGEPELRIKYHTKASSRIRRQACLGELIRLMTGGKQTSGERDQKEHEGSFKVFSQDGHGVMSFFVFVSNFSDRVVLTRVRTHEVATAVCATEAQFTICTHIFVVFVHCAYTSHILMRVTHMHGSRLKGVCSAHVVISLSSHLLPSHVSPVFAPAFP